MLKILVLCQSIFAEEQSPHPAELDATGVDCDSFRRSFSPLLRVCKRWRYMAVHKFASFLPVDLFTVKQLHLRAPESPEGSRRLLNAVRVRTPETALQVFSALVDPACRTCGRATTLYDTHTGARACNGCRTGAALLRGSRCNRYVQIILPHECFFRNVVVTFVACMDELQALVLESHGNFGLLHARVAGSIVMLPRMRRPSSPPTMPAHFSRLRTAAAAASTARPRTTR